MSKYPYDPELVEWLMKNRDDFAVVGSSVLYAKVPEGSDIDMIVRICDLPPQLAETLEREFKDEEYLHTVVRLEGYDFIILDPISYKEWQTSSNLLRKYAETDDIAKVSRDFRIGFYRGVMCLIQAKRKGTA